MIDNSKGEYLYSIAVVTDTHLNQNDSECNSPFDVNRLANNRLRYVIDDLNRRDIKMVIHLGDVVHPVPSMGELYTESSNRFFEQFKNLKHPFFMIPGNHDVGDKPIDWGPAGTVRDDFLQAWTDNFGAHYFHHNENGIHFIGINAQLPGSGLALEEEQKQWLENTLKSLTGQRIFIGSHYPPYLLHEHEPEHYDNLGIAGREWLLSLLGKYKVEGLFCGHVHQYWFHRYQHTQCHLLPSTAFTRQDYSEMFRVDSGDEFGRNDEPKLGYLLLHLFEHGHGIEVVRSGGQELESNQLLKTQAVIEKSPAFSNFSSSFGFEMRQDWFETIHIPPSGGLDEFDRKSVRNDYGLLALLDMGIRKIRLPLIDLSDPLRRSRLIDLKSFGFSYNFYSFGAPDKNLCRLMVEQAELIDSWIICYPLKALDQLSVEFFKLAKRSNIKLIFSPLRSKEDLIPSGKKYYHVINHGFTVNDKVLLDNWIATEQANYFDSYVLRLAHDDSVPAAVDFANKQIALTGKSASVNLRLSENNPAIALNDEAWLCRRLAQAILSTHGSEACDIFSDTFSDNDRGYFPRTGVVDRRYNPRAGFQLVQQLNILLEGLLEPVRIEAGLYCTQYLLIGNRFSTLIINPGDEFNRTDLENTIESFEYPYDLLNLISNQRFSITDTYQVTQMIDQKFPFALLAN
ncbi:MAG: Icc-related predicted phosphoesterase [Gammaproteobacteria bacterium]|jgi:Icc-related predicted phosphoesterase